jgi:hypothetical protein
MLLLWGTLTDVLRVGNTIRATCMVKLEEKQYGVVYYLLHTPAHVCSRFLIHAPTINIDLECCHRRRALIPFTN